MKYLVLILVVVRWHTLAIAVLMLWVAWDFAKWMMRKADEQAKKSKRVV